jgi:hypothetical protein
MPVLSRPGRWTPGLFSGPGVEDAGVAESGGAARRVLRWLPLGNRFSGGHATPA